MPQGSLWWESESSKELPVFRDGLFGGDAPADDQAPMRRERLSPASVLAKEAQVIGTQPGLLLRHGKRETILWRGQHQHGRPALWFLPEAQRYGRSN